MNRLCCCTALILNVLIFVQVSLAESIKPAPRPPVLLIQPCDPSKTTLLNAIKQTKHSIFITMYGLTDHDILKALIAAKHRGVTISILLESHPYKASDENTYAIQQLRKNHITIYTTPNTFHFVHQKTLILDKQTAYILTGNLTYHGLKKQRNFIYITHNPVIIDTLYGLFICDTQARIPCPTPDDDSVISPMNSSSKLYKLIASSHHQVEIYAQELSDWNIAHELVEQHRQQHVRIRILLAKHHSTYQMAVIHYLLSHGIQVNWLIKPYQHAKAMIIDQNTALIGSMNLSKNAIHHNREYMVIIHFNRVVDQLAQQFSADWKQSSQVTLTHK